MSDNLVITIIALLYTASSGVIFYLNQHCFISKKGIRQVVNWPLAKIRDAIVTSILRFSSGETVFDNEREKVEEFYDTILRRRNEEKKVLGLESKLKILKKISMVNIALPMLFLILSAYYVFSSCKNGETLLEMVQQKLILLIILIIIPWLIYFILYWVAENCKAQLDAMEPRNTQERDED